MKNFILILAICLTATCPRSAANVREFNPHSAADLDDSVNKISVEEKLLTLIPKEYSEPGWYEYPLGYYE